jgi:hypothetical protein
MHDGVELLELLRLGEHDAAERSAIDQAVGGQDRRAPSLDDRRIRLRSELHRPAREDVGIDDRRPALAQELRDGRFPAADVAGEADEEHARSGWR